MAIDTSEPHWPEGPYLVIDLDGTISDISKRAHLAQARMWDEFNEACDQDEMHPEIWQLLSHLKGKYQLMVLTGRPERYRERTMRWMLVNFLEVDWLLMKPDNDYSPTAQWKLKMLEEFFEGKDNVIKEVALVLEDRDSMVEAFRNYGLPCWQVRPGGY